MANLNYFEKGAIDYLRQSLVGNAHALLSQIAGDEPETHEELVAFNAGFEFAKKCDSQEPSKAVRDEIRNRLSWEARK